MPQLVTRIDDELAKTIDELVAEGVAESRSEAVRRGLRMLIDQHRRRRTANAIIAGYEALPQTHEESGWRDEATVRMIVEEPW
ncbi:MAG: ribbon-helix-helix protein, CopG family [Acidimicrobiia bacterium]|nr:ribbon-helix-helix protein, CopG family [Acidimicrobiia bacterium]